MSTTPISKGLPLELCQTDRKTREIPQKETSSEVSFSTLGPSPKIDSSSSLSMNPDLLIERTLAENSWRASVFGRTCTLPWFDRYLKYEEVPSSFSEAITLESGTVGRYPFTSASHSGNCPAMQDRNLQTVISITVGEKEFAVPLFAVFDGHGPTPHGETITTWVQQNLPIQLSKELSKCKELTNREIYFAIYTAFLQANKNLFLAFKKPREKIIAGGCTASVALEIGGQWWFANVGDSRTVHFNKDKFRCLTHDAIPSDPFFRQYLEDHYAKYVATGKLSRRGEEFFVPLGEGTECIIGINKKGDYVLGNNGYSVAMVTCFGDFQLMIRGIRPVMCQPTITCSSHEEGYLLLATDGVWGVVSPASMATLTKGGAPDPSKAIYMAALASENAIAEKHKRKPLEKEIDNMGVIVVDLGGKKEAPASTESDNPPSS